MAAFLSDLPLACVIWLDAKGDALGEHTRESIDREYHQPTPFATFGLLVKQNEAGITLAMEQCPPLVGTEHRGLAFIPRGMVVEVVMLGRPKRSKAGTPRKGRGSASTPGTPPTGSVLSGLPSAPAGAESNPPTLPAPVPD
jgi:hypothetical protein